MKINLKLCSKILLLLSLLSLSSFAFIQPQGFDGDYYSAQMALSGFANGRQASMAAYMPTYQRAVPQIGEALTGIPCPVGRNDSTVVQTLNGMAVPAGPGSFGH